MASHITRRPSVDDWAFHRGSDDVGPVGTDPSQWTDSGEAQPQVFSAPGAGLVTVRRPEVYPAGEERTFPWSPVRVDGDAAVVWTALRTHPPGRDLD